VIVAAALLAVGLAASGRAVTSKVTRHSTGKDLFAGESDGVVVSSRGAIQLGRAAKVLASEFEDVWAVNSIVVSGGTIFIGTSPNGHVYKYSLGTLTRIFPPAEEAGSDRPAAKPADAAQPAPEATPDEDAAEAAASDSEQGTLVNAGTRLSNEHIFAMSLDVAGRLLAGISGDRCRLCRYEAGKMETIFEPNDAKYIFDIATDNVGNIYLGTGPQGKVYVLDPSAKVAQLVYTARDKNILSVAASKDGFVYAGSDTRGLIYKINPRNKTATVLYDSDEPEISDLLARDGLAVPGGALYALATSAGVMEAEQKFAAQQAVSGRPESRREEESRGQPEGGMKLKVANTSPAPDSKPQPPMPRPPARPAKPGTASYVYKIDKQGFVTELFSESVVFLCLACQDEKILVGSGHGAQLFRVDPEAEQQTVFYEDPKAAQIAAVAVSEQEIYLGTANPAKLVLLSSNYGARGTFESELIDAGQPARWGKLQIDAEIPRGCRVLVASRSGNVKDVNDPTFSDWTEPVAITEPVALRCPVGRFCQYKLILESDDSRQTPTVREVAVACTIPNLAPKVESVDVSRLSGPGKDGVFKIAYKVSDENEDKTIYTLDFRKIGRTTWVQIKDELEADNYDWDSKTVEDGRYEIRVTASDERSNSPATKLTGRRISEAIVVDNTGPVIRRYALEKNGRTATLKLQITDELSVIRRLDYTVDSQAQWKGALPDDFVCDTTDESFTITTEDLEPGEHVLALRLTDDVGNTTYKTFELNVQGK